MCRDRRRDIVGRMAPGRLGCPVAHTRAGARLKKSRWCLLKRSENLTTPQKGRLKELLRYNLKSVRAYLLKEDFQQFWTYQSPTWAGKFLDAWCTTALRSRIEPMKKIARMCRRHRPLILNWFKAKGRISNGIVEGLNTKAKLTIRRSYGFRSPEILEMALYHALGKLPEPKLTHEFYWGAIIVSADRLVGAAYDVG